MPLPFIKFFPADWEADSQLMDCSLAARGLWLHMIRVMHEAEPYGFFVKRNGDVITIADFARRIAAHPKEVQAAFKELDEAGVFSRDSQGRLYSRRMVRDESRRQQLQENATQFGSEIAEQFAGQNDEQIAEQLGAQLLRARAQNPEAQKPRGLDSDSLRSSAVAVGNWPTDIPGLRSLAVIFLSAFGNCRDVTKAQKYVPEYTRTLAVMRSRNVTITQAWQACEDALQANNGKPLFSAAIKTAIAFLPPQRNGKPVSQMRELT